MSAKRKGTRKERGQMAKDTPKKMMTETEFKAAIRQYRLEAIELIGPSLKILAQCEAARREGRGRTAANRKKRKRGR